MGTTIATPFRRVLTVIPRRDKNNLELEWNVVVAAAKGFMKADTKVVG